MVANPTPRHVTTVQIERGSHLTSRIPRPAHESRIVSRDVPRNVTSYSTLADQCGEITTLIVALPSRIKVRSAVSWSQKTSIACVGPSL